MPCIICKNKGLKKIFSHKILKKYLIDYYYCNNCKFIQTSKPFWLDEAYKHPINKTDTGYISRNISLARKTWLLFILLFGKNKKYLDYAGGYGVFTRLMRDMGLSFFTTDKYTKNLFAQGFEYNNQNISAITCFECLEHLANPVNELEKILKISKNIFFSTMLFNSKKLPDSSWWYFGFEHGQHISFYSKHTLKYLARKHDLYFYTNNNNLHLFLKKNRNNLFLLTILKLGVLPWDILFRLFAKSKTWSDYNNLKKEI